MKEDSLSAKVLGFLTAPVWKHTPRCREMTRLLSAEMERPHPLSLRMRMALHRLFCPWCHRYGVQLRRLAHLLRRLPEAMERSGLLKMPEDARQRLRDKLRGR